MKNSPQHQQMADPSMVRTLDYQARAIWPLERPLFERYGLTGAFDVLDVGCGTGELATRLCALFPQARLLGIDLEPSNLARARADNPDPDRVRYAIGDALALEQDDDTFDLVVCRHLLQAVPTPEKVVAELARVTRPGGRVHLLAEDYGMMHFHPTAHDNPRFWYEGVRASGAATKSDLLSGRTMYTTLKRLGLQEVRLDFITVDTQSVPRDIFAGIWTAWRDGYTDFIANNSPLTRDEVWRGWNEMIACILDEDGYAVWQIPVVSGRTTPR